VLFRSFARLQGWTPLAGGPFPSGVVGDLGALRIASFGEDRYLRAARAAFRPGIGRRELALAVRAELNRELVAVLTALRGRGARRLVVDVTGNGGGTEWVEDVVALLTDRTLVRRASRHVAPQGDRSAVWRGEPVPSVFGPEREPVRIVGRGVWTGPVFVLTDRGTGSASEDFVVWLKENGVAVVLGRRTAGAGGGYVDGGGRIRLAHAPFDVMTPNCARFLRDGTNEIEGIAPDVELPPDDDPDRLAAAFAKATGL
jgi:C-terminal processing protease CtpA/Prc